MNEVIHKANSRGYANHNWLKSYHSFSFANYYNPDRMGFGVLRVLNDDIIAGGTGFGMHPHQNMEIISIPLEGALEHKDSMGNISVISEGEIQVMSAGTGIHHSEYNKNEEVDAKFLQIWIMPNRRNVEPRYEQMRLDIENKINYKKQIISPDKNDDGLWIYQNAWFYYCHYESNIKEKYILNDSTNGVYIFLISGKLEVNNNLLEERDAYAVYDFDSLNIETLEESKYLLMEIPMNNKLI